MPNELVAARPLTVLMPKNRGLAAMAERALKSLSHTIAVDRTAVRGEDVPMLANVVARLGCPLFAMTGDDLLDEWLAGGNVLDASIRRTRVEWNDPGARFGKPALCLIGPRGGTPPTEGTIRVAVCAKYKHLARKYLRALERPGLHITPVIISGTVEAALLHNAADLMIDIVVSGATIDRLALDVYTVLHTSDLAVLEANR